MEWKSWMDRSWHLLGLLLSDRLSSIMLLLLSMLFFVENFDRYLLGVSLIPYINYSSYEYAVLTGTVFSFCYTLGGVIISVIFDIFEKSSSHSKALTVGTLIFSSAFFLTAFATNFGEQICIRMVMGFSQAIITPFSSSLIRNNFAEEVRGMAFGIFNMGTYFAFSLSLSLGTYMYDTLGWKGGYLIFGSLGIILCGFLPFCIPSASSSNNGTKFSQYSIVNESESTENPINNSSKSQYTTIDLSEHEQVLVEEAHMIDRHPCGDEHYSGTFSMMNLSDIKKLVCHIVVIIGSILKYWIKHPQIILLCLATGIRLGAGYVWSSYTAIFFSELFVKDPSGSDLNSVRRMLFDSAQNSSSFGLYSRDLSSSSCSFSYNASYSGPVDSSVCGKSYPYCQNGACYKIASYPWHNKGISHLNLESYMSWVPIVGSAFGSVLGGVLADVIYASDSSIRSSLSSVTSMTTAATTAATSAAAATTLASTTIMAGVNGEEGLCPPKGRLWGRSLVSGIGTLVAAPIVAWSCFSSFPGCFLVLVASGLVGECYFSQTLAMFTELSPHEHITTSLSLLMFFVTIIGGNIPILVPMIASSVSFPLPSEVVLSFEASMPYPGNDDQEMNRVKTILSTNAIPFQVNHSNAEIFQWSLALVLFSCYTISGILYLLLTVMLMSKNKHTEQKLNEDRK